MMDYSDIILAPVITEKSAKNAESNIYTFKLRLKSKMLLKKHLVLK